MYTIKCNYILLLPNYSYLWESKAFCINKIFLALILISLVPGISVLFIILKEKVNFLTCKQNHVTSVAVLYLLEYFPFERR